MREDVLAWATATVGPVLEVHPLHDDQGPWRLVTRNRSVVLRAPTPRIDAAMIATAAAALQLAEQYGVPAPRLIAAVPAASLETVVPGTSDWPLGTPESLRAAGATLARLHTIPLEPADHLPFRPRPIAVDDFATDRRTGRMPTTPLLEEADNVVQAHGLPPGPSVFLHGDAWPGNLIWSGWQQTSGHEATHVPYWDAVAALNTPTTLHSPTATTRRDAFLTQALTQLR
ncbi:phosphotransferase [Kribbella sp. NPDC059898]|uniref:phosphotransferase n=1 Tax=Kribbella sp. NPDC059898 TaxID=3346995 RepID=UPI0036588B5C